jgi:hypothetical protein
VQFLAALWSSAWKVGKKPTLPDSKLRKFEESELEDVYRDRKFVPSLSLEEMAKSGKFEP